MNLITQAFDLALDLRCVYMHKYQVDVGGFADERFFFQQGTGQVDSQDTPVRISALDNGIVSDFQ
jgi:hypothetical protein